ncbi:hypothetical protein FOL47_006277 [Perkinsus chesapeaki]|uniref:Uncharacterized protein n=1 Tax=Perkinsus chesapeaki TaxID=330153 RepID=A0A7J6LSS5_PERCH|nr:hypothetical protein FOL47_006277 [Perkinsus chesapeaki]
MSHISNRLSPQLLIDIATQSSSLDQSTPLVRVCISCHTHYCDITGETPWVARNLLPLHAAAQANKTYIVNFCGFDSQPADLLVAEAQRILQEPLDRANALVAMRGSMSGGTLRSGIEMEALPEMSDPYCLGGSPGKESENDAHPIERSDRLGCWLAPFGMAMINTRVVRRSASLKGRQFPYGEAMCVSDEKTAKRLASVPSAEVRKKLVERGKLPRPGQGPDPLTRTRSWFKYVVSATGKSGKEIWLQLSGGDAGYDETALMVSEAAVALLNGEAISGRWGVVTPGYAFDSQKMINRLVNAGLEFQRLPGAPSVGTILERPSRNAVQGKWREAVADMSAIMSRFEQDSEDPALCLSKMDFGPNLTTSTFKSATFATRAAKLDSGLVSAAEEFPGDDSEFDIDFLDFRRTLIDTIKSLIEAGAVADSQAVIDLKKRLRDVERDGACHRWNKKIKNPEITHGEVSAAAVRQARRRINQMRQRQLMSSSDKEGKAQAALVPITDPVRASVAIVDGQAMQRFRAAARILFLAYSSQQYLRGEHTIPHELNLDGFERLCDDLSLTPILISESECREVFSSESNGDTMNIAGFFSALDVISNVFARPPHQCRQDDSHRLAYKLFKYMNLTHPHATAPDGGELLPLPTI